ncbi:MAG: aldose 1-epimerase family protein [Romboutsia sp.]|uniref:aldose 1-epimerase family protein n=1 Tax=Romboutsia sp. TaxID=1965302 RepID=UPI003F36AF97
MYILENENLIIESKSSGAELTRIFSTKLNKEILWNADSNFWGRHSPILFPIVGKLQDNETVIEDSTYNMSQHGFARDMDFDILNRDENTITYKLVSNSNTKKLYPYSFELLVKYTLLNSSVEIQWTVINTDDKEIYFSIGAHPAFNLNFNNCDSLSDYYLEFKHRGNVDKILLNGPYADNKVSIEDIKTLSICNDSFKNDALIYTNIDQISLRSNKCNEVIKVDFKDFPLVGIWTPYYKETNSTAPFLCIEPWYGLADSVDYNKTFKNKNYINTLSIGEIFSTSYSITI